MRALEQYLREDYTHNELADCATHGCVAGFGNFVYYSDNIKHFEMFRDDIFDVIEEQNELWGTKGLPKYVNENSADYAQFCNSMVWFAVEVIAWSITRGEYIEEEQSA